MKPRANAALRFALAALAVCALSLSIFEVSLQVSAAEPPTIAKVTEGLTCQCGCGLTVSNCNHPTCGFAVPMRLEIDRMIGEGMDAGQIIAFYRRKYGEKVLSAPTTEGFNLLAWVMPFAAIMAGGGAMMLWLGKWRGAPRPAAPAAVPVFDDELRRKLEAELKDGI